LPGDLLRVVEDRHGSSASYADRAAPSIADIPDVPFASSGIGCSGLRRRAFDT